MTDTLSSIPTRPHLHVLVFGDGVDVLGIPQRSYDFDKGDRRFTVQAEAIQYANDEAVRTSVRRIVRVDSSPHFTKFYLVQAIGS